MQCFEGPPDAFHVLFVHGFVGTFKVDPAANAVNILLPEPTGFDHIVACGGYIFCEANLGTNIAAIFNAQLFLGKHFGRQTMAIPAPHALNALTFHSPVAWHCIFDDARKQRSMVWHPCNKWWAIIKHIGVIFWSAFNRLFKRLIFFPLLNPILFVLDRSSASPCFEFHSALRLVLI